MHTIAAREFPLRTEVIDGPASVSRLASDWRALFERCSARTPFQSPEWLLPWIEAFRPSSLRVIATWENNRLVGLAPLLIYPRGAERLLAFAGGGVSDYLDLLAEPGKEAAVVREIFLAALEDASWTAIELTDLAPNSAVIQHHPLRQLASTHDRSSVLPLRTDTSELAQMFSRRQRANLRNARSRLARHGGGVVECATRETMPEFLEDLFRLHTLRWSERGEPGVLHEEQLRGFHRMAARPLLDRGLLRLYRLRVEEGTAAVIYALFDGDTVYCYLQGFDPKFRSFSPGTLLMYSVIEDAAGCGMRVFDFLRGEETYKQHWRSEGRLTYCIRLERRSLQTLGSSETHEAA